MTQERKKIMAELGKNQILKNIYTILYTLLLLVFYLKLIMS